MIVDYETPATERRVAVKGDRRGVWHDLVYSSTPPYAANGDSMITYPNYKFTFMALGMFSRIFGNEAMELYK